MQITEIYYEKVFPIAPYVNEKIGVKVTLTEEEGLKEPFVNAAFDYAKIMVESWGHKMVEEARTFDAPAQLKGNARWDTKADTEFEELKKQLDTFVTEKDAIAYLQITPFKLSIEAKNYIKQKFAQP